MSNSTGSKCSTIPPELVHTLATIQDLSSRNNVRWVLVGSLSLAIQGVKVPANDIDIATDEEGAFRLGELLQEFVIRPIVWTEGAEFASYFGQFALKGVSVEVMGNFHAWEGGRWVDLSCRLDDPVLATVQDFQVPVSRLEDQLASYKNSRRDKDRFKADAIESALRGASNRASAAGMGRDPL
jgi:hypothetical protein